MAPNRIIIFFLFDASFALRLWERNLDFKQPELVNVMEVELVNVMEVEDVLESLKSEYKRLDARKDASEVQRWRQAQAHMINQTAKIREWEKKRGTYLYDQHFFESFSKALKDDDFFLGLVFIPIPWKRIVENGPRGSLNGKKDKTGLKMALGVLKSLDPSFKYFTVMSQSHAGQVIEVGGEDFKSVPWHNILVFDSRGADRNQIVPRIPIPLLYRNDAFSMQDANKLKYEQKEKQVFFAGSCHGNNARNNITNIVPPSKLAGGRYKFEIHKCNEKVPQKTYYDKLQRSRFVIAPPGSMPTAFMIYEALQAGSFAIIPYEEGKLGPNKPFLWLPYHDIGVRWQHGVAELFAQDDWKKIKTSIEDIDEESVQKRQSLLKHVQPLFFAEGLTAYILYMAKVAHRTATLFQMQNYEEALGYAVNRVRTQSLAKVQTRVQFDQW